MKNSLGIGTLLIIMLMLAGCFPSQRLYRIDYCDPATAGCGSVIFKHSELVFAKETTGDNWRLWQKQPSGIFDEICIGTVDGNTFSCDKCGPGKTFLVKKAAPSDCSFGNCITIELNGPNCPGGGQGSAGHN